MGLSVGAGESAALFSEIKTAAACMQAPQGEDSGALVATESATLRASSHHLEAQDPQVIRRMVDATLTSGDKVERAQG